MTITAALVLYAVTWFMVFFIVLPIRFRSQGDVGEVVPGTPAGAPAGFVVVKKAKITTLLATVIWAVLASIIISGAVGIRDIDLFDRWNVAIPKEA